MHFTPTSGFRCAFGALALAALFFTSSQAWGIDAQGLFQDAQDSVVLVLVIDESGNPTRIGSGFLLGRGSMVATNQHVIAGAEIIKVKLANGKLMDVSAVIAESAQYDLAIIEIPNLGKGLSLASGKPEVGEEIMAIGNPKGLERTLSTGVVSGIRMVGETMVYQITAPISPGSSGGPILNSRGEVLGLATFYAKGGQNLNFAIPSTYINKILGKSTTRSLGSSGGGKQRGSKLEFEKKDGGITIFAK